jgi:hypothetical protein
VERGRPGRWASRGRDARAPRIRGWLGLARDRRAGGVAVLRVVWGGWIGGASTIGQRQLFAELVEGAGLHELGELAEDVGEVGLAVDLVDGEDVVGEAPRLAGRPADDAVGGTLVFGAHPVGERAVLGQLDLPVHALFAEVLLAIGGELGGGGEQNVLINAQREKALGRGREPVAVVGGPFGLALLELAALVAPGIGLGFGAAGLGLELADFLLLLIEFELLVGQFDLEILGVDVGALALQSAEDIRGALADAGFPIAELEALVLAGQHLVLDGVADAGAPLQLEVELVVDEGEFLEFREGHTQPFRRVGPRMALGAQVRGALEDLLVVGVGGSDHGDTGKEDLHDRDRDGEQGHA